MKKIFGLLGLLLIITTGFSQKNILKDFSLNGYLSQMNQTIIDSVGGNWINDGLVHNRFKLNYSKGNFFFDFELRNRLFYGETVKFTPNFAANYENDRGFFDLSYNVADGNSFVLNSSIDRFIFMYQINKFVATIGRQRINWGSTFVWNPNDLFNSYSFFDFEYAERPGSDAVYLQYFIDYDAEIGLAAKINSDTALTIASRYRFNLGSYDIQLISGYLDDEDIAIGLGWSGNIRQITFRGEGTYLQPLENFVDTSGTFIGSIGFDYLFGNGAIILGEFLYNHSAGGLNISNLYDIQSAPMSIKNLSFSKYNVVLQVSYPISSVINVSLATMYMNTNNWLFFSPNFDVSVSQDVDFSLVGQIFTGKMLNPVTLKDEQKIISLIFVRFKYSF